MRGDLQVQLTLVVLRGGRVERVEHATLEPPAAHSLLRAWPGRWTGQGRLQPAGHRCDRLRHLYLTLAILCTLVAAVILLVAA